MYVSTPEGQLKSCSISVGPPVIDPCRDKERVDRAEAASEESSTPLTRNYLTLIVKGVVVNLYNVVESRILSNNFLLTPVFAMPSLCATSINTFTVAFW